MFKYYIDGEMNIANIDPLLIGFVLIFVGIAIIFISIIYLMYKSFRGETGKVEGGGVIIIGPIPIVFGTSEKITKLLIVLAIILFIFVLLLYFIPFYLHKMFGSIINVLGVAL